MGCSSSVPQSSSFTKCCNKSTPLPTLLVSCNKSVPRIKACTKPTPFPSGGDFDSNWRILHSLGQGSYAKVYAVKDRRSSRCAAIKILKESDDNHELDKEAIVWKKIGRHDNIVSLIDTFVFQGKHALLMEICDASLGERILGAPNFSESTLALMFCQMASAIAHLESLKFVHRDIKPDNFLCVGEGQNLKLCDFGFAKQMPKFGKLYGTYGTPRFMSPEMVGDGPHDFKTDVWSMGATWYLMLYGEGPYATSHSSAKGAMQAIAMGHPQPKYEGRGNVSDVMKESVVVLLHRPRASRILATQALRLPCMALATTRHSTKSPTPSSAEFSDVASESTRDTCSSASESTFIDYISELASPKYTSTSPGQKLTL